MASTTTGLDRWLDFTGTSVVHEYQRLAMTMMSEASEEAVANPTYPRTVDVLRKVVVSTGDPVRMTKAIWESVKGLTDIKAWVWLPSDWNDRAALVQGMPILREGERIVVLADIPAGGDVAANRLATTDRIQYDDPTYGVQAFEITRVEPNPGPGLVRVTVQYAREESD